MLETGLASHSMAYCHGLKTTRSVKSCLVENVLYRETDDL